MELSNEERFILTSATKAFQRETGLELTTQQTNPDPTIDAVLSLPTQHLRLNAIIKRWAQHTNIGALVAQAHRVPEPAILVADYINPNAANRLRENGVSYIDTCGNAFLAQPPLHVFVKGHRPDEASRPSSKKSRAFNASGLRLVFSLLVIPDLISRTYREIAFHSGVSLGTVGWILNDLKQRGYISDTGKRRQRTLLAPLDLLDRWAEAYPERLQPELQLGEFQFRSAIPWQDIHLNSCQGLWGGEVGAHILDHYLTPEKRTVYLPKHRLKDFVVQNRLRKAQGEPSRSDRTVQIYELFWKPFEEATDHRHVHAPDILIYADLLSTGDPRNLEAANRIYERIKDRFQHD